MSKEVSRFLSLVLRHKPETIGIKLDKNGWVKVIDLLDKLQEHGKGITLDELKSIVDNNDKQRFGFSKDGIHIRANQGHSLNVDLQLKAVRPPSVLYHGTSKRFQKEIETDGLKKMNRDHVHLSEDVDVAINVALRRGKDYIIYKINSWHMDSNGIKFYKSENGVWLTDYVSHLYLKLHDDATKKRG